VRFLLIAALSIHGVACKSDPPGAAPAPAASASPLDTTPLKGAPTTDSIAGWWIVETGFVSPNDEPGHKPGHAWWFARDAMRLVFGDATDRRPITGTQPEGDALRLEIEGDDLLVTRRANGIAVRFDQDELKIPLRRASAAEVSAIDALDKKKQKMLDRACEKALECCTAARGKGVAKDNDCTPLLGLPDMAVCIQAITVFKNKAAAAKIVIPECMPDK
jgi:hypothetical protein